MSDQLTGSKPVIVALPAEIDLSNAEQVYEQLTAALTGGAAVVIADFTGTRFCAGRPRRPWPGRPLIRPGQMTPVRTGR